MAKMHPLTVIDLAITTLNSFRAELAERGGSAEYDAQCDVTYRPDLAEGTDWIVRTPGVHRFLNLKVTLNRERTPAPKRPRKIRTSSRLKT